MSVESLLDHYYERATIPIRNTKFGREQKGSLDIRHVVEDDEFRQLNHKIVLKDGVASSVWREQEWGLGENSLDVTHFEDGIVKQLSLRHTGDAVTGMKVSLTRGDWLMPDPDLRLPYIFGRADMETWYKAAETTMGLSRVRLAWDYETKHTFPVRDHGISKDKGEHLYKGVEYRIELDDAIRLSIDGKSSRKVNWRMEISADDVRSLFEYASDESWIDGWDHVANIIENGK
ncbi:hypothetical protein [Candidatus Lucifugimonas marina]|uniref:hypothetical protein n=1 Tax=Candidatus Lucifugimonas marina TaxID=3038979 RepID=UPI0027A8D53C|nr:hypothetical protein GKN94_08650 [SAR202 cluster bacterium JH545]